MARLLRQPSRLLAATRAPPRNGFRPWSRTTDLATRLAAVESLVNRPDFADLVAAAPGTFGATTLEGRRASYFAVAGKVWAEFVTYLPPADVSQLGRLVVMDAYAYVQGGDLITVAPQLYICAQTSTDGVYEWGVVGQVSP